MQRKKPVKVKRVKRKKKSPSLLKTFKKFLKRSNKFFFFIGVFLISASSFYIFNNVVDQMIVTRIAAVNSCAENKQSPSSLFIPAQGISAEIEDSVRIGNLWQISSKKVSHLKNSGVPGQGGNIIMYGHNTKNNFGSLQFLKEGETIVLKTRDDTRYAYTITSIKTVFPTDVEVVKSTEEEVLTLYTCIGFGDTMRLVIRAVPAKSTVARSENKICKSEARYL